MIQKWPIIVDQFSEYADRENTISLNLLLSENQIFFECSVFGYEEFRPVAFDQVSSRCPETAESIFNSMSKSAKNAIFGHFEIR